MSTDTVTASHPHLLKNGVDASLAVVHFHVGMGGRVEGLVWGVGCMVAFTLKV